MTETPWDGRDLPIDDPDAIRMPGPEDGPFSAPRDVPVPNDGDLDVGDPPTSIEDRESVYDGDQGVA